MFPLIRLRLRALRLRLFDRFVRRLARRHRLLSAVVGVLVARLALDKVLWRGVVRSGEGLVVTVRPRGTPTPGGD